MALLIASASMELAHLVAGSSPLKIVGSDHVAITGLACHTAAVRPGSLFFCVPGTRHDGHAFAGQAVAAGAAALVVERLLDVPVPQVVVASARRAMGLMAAQFYGQPTTQLLVAGVTGTNGKTTTAHLIAAACQTAGLPCALLGTVVNRIGGREEPVTLTTADSIDLQRMFREMVAAGDRACAMEASSHALFMDRTVAVDFDAVVFTNLTRDHLDFHRDLEEYYLAKRRLFLPDGERQPHATAIVAVGDAWGRRLADECRPVYGDDVVTYAVEGDQGWQDADVVAVGVRLGRDGAAFQYVDRRTQVRQEMRMRLGGRFNVANAVAATAACQALGVSPAAAAAGLAAVPGVPGRFEAVRAGQSFTVLVDYSHTPDSLQNVLRAARDIADGRLFVVFGCGGDRDRGKRPQMGAVAAQLADVAVVTSDNPRSEDPQAIIAEILAGIPDDSHAEVIVEPDRRCAIELALARAREGDVVVIAGKGHETGQIVGTQKLPFDDRAVAHELLTRRVSAERS